MQLCIEFDPTAARYQRGSFIVCIVKVHIELPGTPQFGPTYQSMNRKQVRWNYEFVQTNLSYSEDATGAANAAYTLEGPRLYVGAPGVKFKPKGDGLGTKGGGR